MRFLIFVFILLIGCEQTVTSVSYKADWDSQKDGNEWTKILSVAIDRYGQDLLSAKPSDGGTYSYQQTKQFWIMLISSMARFESAFKPETSYTEKFADANGVRVVSRGLLQISIESGKGYGCVIPKAEDLHDPKVNLECGVKILNKWVPKDGVIGTNKKGGARYWSVLRESNSSRDKIIAKMKDL